MMLEAFGVTEDELARPVGGHGAARLRASRSRPATSAGPSPPWPPTRTGARWNQQSVTSAELAGAYGFTDVDGSRPDVWRYELDGATDPAGYR